MKGKQNAASHVSLINRANGKSNFRTYPMPEFLNFRPFITVIYLIYQVISQRCPYKMDRMSVRPSIRPITIFLYLHYHVADEVVFLHNATTRHYWCAESLSP